MELRIKSHIPTKNNGSAATPLRRTTTKGHSPSRNIRRRIRSRNRESEAHTRSRNNRSTVTVLPQTMDRQSQPFNNNGSEVKAPSKTRDLQPQPFRKQLLGLHTPSRNSIPKATPLHEWVKGPNPSLNNGSAGTTLHKTMDQ